MSPHDQLKEHNQATLSAFEEVYSDIHRLYARMSRTEETMKELEIALSQTLAELVTDGVTDPKELRRRAFQAVARSIR